MSVVSTLVANMVAKTSDFEAGMKRAKNSADGMTKSVAFLKRGVAALGVGISVGTIFNSFMRLSETADRVKDMAAAMGTSVAEMRRLEYAMAGTGGKAEDLHRNLAMLYRKIYEGGEGSKEAAEALRILGVSVNQLQRSPVMGMAALAKSFERLGATSYSAKLAYDLFGRAYLDILPMLSQGADYFKKMADESKRFAEFTDASASAMETYAATWARVKMSFEGQAMKGASIWSLVLGGGGSRAQELMGEFKRYNPVGFGSGKYKSAIYRDIQAAQYTLEQLNLEAERKRINDQSNTIRVMQLEKERAAQELLNKEIEDSIRKQAEWAANLVSEADTPLDRFAKKLQEIAQLREYFFRDNLMTMEEQATIQKLVNFARENALDAMKGQDKTKIAHDANVEMSSWMTVSGLRLSGYDKSFEEQKKQTEELQKHTIKLNEIATKIGLN